MITTAPAQPPITATTGKLEAPAASGRAVDGFTGLSVLLGVQLAFIVSVRLTVTVGVRLTVIVGVRLAVIVGVRFGVPVCVRLGMGVRVRQSVREVCCG
jgi:hypothetical protein